MLLLTSVRVSTQSSGPGSSDEYTVRIANDTHTNSCYDVTEPTTAPPEAAPHEVAKSNHGYKRHVVPVASYDALAGPGLKKESSTSKRKWGDRKSERALVEPRLLLSRVRATFHEKGQLQNTVVMISRKYTH